MSIDRLIIEKATITDGNEGTKYNISASVTDIVIYEHIDKPYLTGAVTFLDTLGVLDKIKFKGLEEFFLQARYPEDASPFINRRFIIDSVVDTTKSNDNSEMITLHFIEEIGFVSSFLNVNRAYSGSSREIIEKIIMENFSGITLSKADEDEAKYNMQIVVPNMRPLEAANWIKDRTTSTSGTPYYLFSVLTQPGILHFLPLSTLISGSPVNSQEYKYSQSSTQESTTSKSAEAQYYDIKNYNQVPLEISDLIDQGLISSVQGYWDTSTSYDTSTQFEIENVLGLVQGFDRNNFKFKNTYQHLGKSLNTIKSRKQYAIHSSYSYPDKVSFRELENLNRSLTAKALRNILVTGALDISVSGRTFAVENKNRTLGNLINLRFLNNETPTTSSSIDDITDKVKSGKHMIYAVRHNIRLERYDVTLTCVKLENKK